MFRKGKRNIENMKFIKNVATEAEAVIIQGLLESCEIYTQLDYDSESGSYMKVILGTSSLGVNIYVREEEYEQAMEILNAPETTEEE